ncbi:MAG: PA2778 family cysteine peptidase [Steroidobacteraceae bacterium]|nr:PA2778 family cysteine peptidase [Steroidobacteraceae bacterium]
MTRAAFAAVLLPLLSACASQPPLRELLPADAAPSAELTATPFFAQDEYQCGPAALATVLTAAGVQVTPEELVPLVYLPARRGSLQPELLGAARRHGRVPYTLAPNPSAFLAELAAGHPVLVLQNLGTRQLPGWHYAVLVGYDAAAERAILRSGTTERLEMPWQRFLATSARAEHWAVIVPGPGQLPATAGPQAWVAAVAAVEGAGQPEAARRAYEAGLARWPAEPLLWLGRGNAAYATADSWAAVESFRSAAQLAPANAAVRHNLAQALLDAGCPHSALREARAAAGQARVVTLADAAGALAERAAQAAAGAPEDPPRCDAPSAGAGPGS